jgi:hypothetical protein
MRNTVHLADPEELLVVDTDARDNRNFEKVGMLQLGGRGTIKGWLETHPGMFHAWVTWNAARRQGLTELTWEEWDGRVTQIDSDRAGGELPDPTNGEASAGSS